MTSGLVERSKLFIALQMCCQLRDNPIPYYSTNITETGVSVSSLTRFLVKRIHPHCENGVVNVKVDQQCFN